jgi:hypothetical protein
MLLDKGTDVNAQGGRYGNALHAASEGDHEAVVKMLVAWVPSHHEGNACMAV